MKPGLIYITMILDCSGSMKTIQHATISGFNSFIKEQNKLPGEAKVTLVQFDHRYQVDYLCLELSKVPQLTNTTYVPDGWTAMNDAICRTIDELGSRLAELPESERPEKNLVVILTDGEENASVSFTSRDIKEKITHQKEKYSWEFVFLGANIDAISVANDIGINPNASITYAANSRGITEVLTSGLVNLVKNYRNDSAVFGFSQKDRDAQTKAGVAP